MIIDCHGHFTTAPGALKAWREKQLSCANDPANAPGKSSLSISDDEIRAAIEKLKAERAQEKADEQ